MAGFFILMGVYKPGAAEIVGELNNKIFFLPTSANVNQDPIY